MKKVKIITVGRGDIHGREATEMKKIIEDELANPSGRPLVIPESVHVENVYFSDDNEEECKGYTSVPIISIGSAEFRPTPNELNEFRDAFEKAIETNGTIVSCTPIHVQHVHVPNTKETENESFENKFAATT